MGKLSKVKKSNLKKLEKARALNPKYGRVLRPRKEPFMQEVNRPSTSEGHRGTI